MARGALETLLTTSCWGRGSAQRGRRQAAHCAASMEQKVQTHGLCRETQARKQPCGFRVGAAPAEGVPHPLRGIWGLGSEPPSPEEHFSFSVRATSLDSQRSRRKMWRRSLCKLTYGKTPAPAMSCLPHSDPCSGHHSTWFLGLRTGADLSHRFSWVSSWQVVDGGTSGSITHELILMRQGKPKQK
ncbi:uncharacterized protein LOC125915523 [Panthera uncia]|uniref:uncharacterized protein LOC125915523 n=1 Tax=Panthera uncia TaxID=29064 RepID=UPI0020FFDBD6|nr:uncharacterized protein LOC125915523 [Panthera uncia]